MKYIIMALTVMLAAMLFVLEVSKAEATTLEIHQVIIEDHNGNVIQSEYMAYGASLSQFELPEAPLRQGYVFIGWSGELPDTMPDASIVFVPLYMQQQLNLNVSV